MKPSVVLFLLAALAGRPQFVTAAEPGSPVKTVDRSAESVLDGERRIRDVLGRRASFDFRETPLGEVARRLGEKHGIEVGLDIAALTADGRGEETEITYRFDQGLLKSGLKQLLDPHGLTYVVEDEQLLITTKTAAETKLSTRVYSVADLIGPPSGGALDGSEFEPLINVITWTVAIETWRAEPYIHGYRQSGIAALVITQTETIHDEIAELLAALRRARDLRPAAAEPIAPATAAPPQGGDNAAPTKPRWPNGRTIYASDVERRIDAALDSRPIFETPETSLADLAQSLRTQFAIPVELDLPALTPVLAAAEYDIEGKIVVTSSDRKLYAALTTMLSPLGLGYGVENGTLLVTSKEAAESLRHLRLYQVHDLVYRENDLGAAFADFERLIQLVDLACAGGSRREHGGLVGVITAFEGPGIAVLAVLQTPGGHREIEALLEMLRAARTPDLRAAEAASPPIESRTTDYGDGRRAVRYSPPPPPLRTAPQEAVRGTSAAEAAIERALAGPSQLERRNWKLAELAAAIRERYKIDVGWSEPELTADGKDGATVVQIAGGDGSLFDVLKLALDREGLATIVRDERLEITTKTGEEVWMPVRVYPVHDLLFMFRTPEGPRPEFEYLLELISSTIQPESWREGGYGGTTTEFDGPGVHALVMQHSQSVYRQIDRLLAMLRAAYVPELYEAQRRRPVEAPADTPPANQKGHSGGGMF